MKKIYLAIPYGGMEESSYRQAEAAIGAIMQLGHNPFSLILHGHTLTKLDLDIPGDWNYWEAMGKQYMDWADEIWVLIPEEGVEKVYESAGVFGEIVYAHEKSKPVRSFTCTKDYKIKFVANPEFNEET